LSGRFPFLNSDQDLFDIVDESSKDGSYFGNYDIDIYDEDIEALKEGKILIYVDEYGFRVHYKSGKKPNPETEDNKGNKDRSYAWEDWPE
jgi:hypothetical protein